MRGKLLRVLRTPESFVWMVGVTLSSISTGFSAGSQEGLSGSYNVVDIREEGRKIDSPAGPREVCGHILDPHFMTYWDFYEQCGLRVSIFMSLIVTYYC
jgi:hypothetical protein